MVWTKKLALETRKLAKREAEKRQALALRGFFTGTLQTCDIEQEVQVVNRTNGLPLGVESYFERNTEGVRPDTTTFIVEYDANGITPLTREGLEHLYESFVNKTRIIQDAVKATNDEAIIVPIGLNPFVSDEVARTFVVSDEKKRVRYEIMDKRTYGENPHKRIRIAGADGEQEIVAKASNLAAMSRCSGTQIHMSEQTVEDALETHNLLIAVTPLMVALFGNSPFLEAVDTGMVSGRIELLRQAEQRRAGLPSPAFSLQEYYESQLNKALPPFIETEDSVRALELSLGAIHTTTRLQVDLVKRTIRNEIRQIDSQSPFRTMQAMMFILGLRTGLKGKSLPSFADSIENFQNCVYGLSAPFKFGSYRTVVQDVALQFIELSLGLLRRQGMTKLANRFLKPLAAEVASGFTQATRIRQLVARRVEEGMSRKEALTVILGGLNKEALEVI